MVPCAIHAQTIMHPYGVDEIQERTEELLNKSQEVTPQEYMVRVTRAMQTYEQLGVYWTMQEFFSVVLPDLKPEDYPLEMAQCWDALGNLSLSNSDLKKAQRAYNLADSLRDAIFPSGHPLRAIADYHLSKIQFYNYSRNHDLINQAYATAEKSLDGLSADHHMQYLDHAEFLRNAAYTWKIKRCFDRQDLGLHPYSSAIDVRPRYHAALKKAQEQFGAESYAAANVLHNLGNSYTDVFGIITIRDSIEGRACLDTALSFYDHSLLLREKLGLGLSERSVMTWFTKGIALRSIWDQALTDSSSTAFLRGIELEHELHAQYSQHRSFRTVNNPSQTLEIYNLLLTNALITYIRTGNVSSLNEAAPHLHKAELIWKELLKENETQFLHEVVSNYGREPFTISLEICINRYLETPSSELAIEIMTLLEKQKQAQTERWSGVLHEDETHIQATVSKVLESIDAEQASLFHMSAGSNQLFVLLWSQGKLHVERIDPEIDQNRLTDFNNHYHVFQESLAQRDLQQIRTTSNELYDLLIGPFGDVIQNKVYNLTQSSYPGFTLDYLFDGEHYFIEEYQVHQLSSMSAYGQDSIEANPVQLLAVPYNKEQHLPHAMLCLEELGKSGHVYRELHSKQALNEVFVNGSLVHLAGHALANPEKPKQAGFLLPNDTVYLQEFLDLEPVDFVFLHACETALGFSTKLNNNLSLSWAFTHNGTRSQVVSLWPIDDLTSAQLTKGFYTHWEAGASHAEALRRAKLEFLNEHKGSVYENPFYWAGLASLDCEMKRGDSTDHPWKWAWCLVLLPLYFVYQRVRK